MGPHETVGWWSRHLASLRQNYKSVCSQSNTERTRTQFFALFYEGITYVTWKLGAPEQFKDKTVRYLWLYLTLQAMMSHTLGHVIHTHYTIRNWPKMDQTVNCIIEKRVFIMISVTFQSSKVLDRGLIKTSDPFSTLLYHDVAWLQSWVGLSSWLIYHYCVLENIAQFLLFLGIHLLFIGIDLLFLGSHVHSN